MESMCTSAVEGACIVAHLLLLVLHDENSSDAAAISHELDDVLMFIYNDIIVVRRTALLHVSMFAHDNGYCRRILLKKRTLHSARCALNSRCVGRL